MASDIDVSIVIPCRDSGATIGQQLEAIASQEWDGSWEVIVADNGSSDDTVAVVEQFDGRIPHLRVVDASGARGPAHARNVGARAARGRTLLFCDADDVVGEGWLAAMGDALERQAFVSARLDPVALNLPWVRESREFPFTTKLEPVSAPPHLRHTSGGLIGVRRAAHEAVGGFDESLLVLEDSDYCFRIQLDGVPLGFVPDAVVHYRGRDSIPGIYRQARAWGEGMVGLERRYGARARWHALLRGWKPIVLDLLGVVRKQGRARLVWRLGWQLGRIRGLVRRAPENTGPESGDGVARRFPAPSP